MDLGLSSWFRLNQIKLVFVKIVGVNKRKNETIRNHFFDEIDKIMTDIQIRLESSEGYLFARYNFVLTDEATNETLENMIRGKLLEEYPDGDYHERVIVGLNLDLFNDILGKDAIIQMECRFATSKQSI